MNGFVAYEGPSALDGEPIVVVVTGLKTRSKNSKTGPMVQSFILRQDRPPQDVRRSGDDATICGTCPLRAGNGCYVRVEQGPRVVWDGWRRGIYPALDLDGAQAALSGRSLRVGTYGDPSAVPGASAFWGMLVEVGSMKNTGYTHMWREQPDLQSVAMASVHTPAEREAANALGFRTFRSGDGEPLPGEILCPASEEAGRRTTCAECGLCNGTFGPTDRRKDIFIPLHGSKKRKALLAIADPA